MVPTDARIQTNSQTGYLRVLVEALMDSPGLQRPELSRKIGLPRIAVSDLLANLEIRGMVQVAGSINGMPGRSQQFYTLRNTAALALGFDVGGTKLAGALCDMRGNILAERTVPTTRNGAAALVDQIATMANAMCADASLPRAHVRHTTIGLPAAVDPVQGSLSMAGNLPGLEGVALLEPLSLALGCAVHLDNDVNLALIAELAHGSAQGEDNVAFVALGTGIGSALLINGHLLRGAFGGAGEIGYMPLWQLEMAGLPALEYRVGEAGIRHLYRAAGGASEHSVRDIFDAAAAEDVAACAALDSSAETVARGLVCLLSLVDAQVVVLGGSIGARQEFIDRVQTRMAQSWIRPVQIRRSDAGGRAGLLGALELARQSMLENLFGPLPKS
jgi:predicted NBD/HSP70 family sugar kinase